jgi:glycosyltransferase involved in cell wall biosynthesis
MVGPVVKIDEAALPRRPNLHYLGQQPYALLPQLVAGWSVCLMPFALNESTEFISPTKTLEYMAAGKPVVSTPIHDVRAMFGDIVAIASSADLFIAACRQALRESPAQTAERAQRMAARVGKYSWDEAAETIRRSLDAVLAAPRASPVDAPARSSSVRVARATSPSVAIASISAEQRPDDDPTALPLVVSAG